MVPDLHRHYDSRSRCKPVPGTVQQPEQSEVLQTQQAEAR